MEITKMCPQNTLDFTVGCVFFSSDTNPSLRQKSEKHFNMADLSIIQWEKLIMSHQRQTNFYARMQEKVYFKNGLNLPEDIVSKCQRVGVCVLFFL